MSVREKTSSPGTFAKAIMALNREGATNLRVESPDAAIGGGTFTKGELVNEVVPLAAFPKATLILPVSLRTNDPGFNVWEKVKVRL